MTRSQVPYLALDCDSPHDTTPFLPPPPSLQVFQAFVIVCSPNDGCLPFRSRPQLQRFGTPVSSRRGEETFHRFSHPTAMAVSAHSQETIVNHSEKGSSAQAKDHYASLPPLLYDESLVTADLVQGDSANTYKYFLRQCPEYKLTWLLDSLRKSDFKRLEKSTLVLTKERPRKLSFFQQQVRKSHSLTAVTH